MKTYKVIAITDTHLPYEDKKTLSAIEQYMADERWDEYLHLGDLMDFQYISKYNSENGRAVSGKTFHKDYENTNKFLDRHQEIIRKNNKDAKFTLLEGNHDYRVEAWIDKCPNLEGLVEFDKNLRLNQRGFKFVRSWSKGQVYRIGKANFVHGLYTGTHHAKKMVENFGKSMYYGHLHDIQCYPKVMKGANKTIVGQSLGCTCDYEQTYMKGAPSNWQHAVTTFYFLPNGNYTYYVSQIINHTFVAPNGKVYAGV